MSLNGAKCHRETLACSSFEMAYEEQTRLLFLELVRIVHPQCPELDTIGLLEEWVDVVRPALGPTDEYRLTS